MEKTTFQKLAELFGFHVNVDAIEEVSTNEMDYPENWDEMSEEEQAEWMDKNGEKMKDNSSDDDAPSREPARRPVSRNARQTQVPGGNPGPDVTNLLKLNSLIDEIGGFDAYKGLLLSAVEAVESYQVQHNQERDTLVAQIVANSAGAFEESDLEEIPVPTLKKMAKSYGHDVTVDYSLLNPGVKANKKDIAAMPSIESLFRNSKEE